MAQADKLDKPNKRPVVFDPKSSLSRATTMNEAPKQAHDTSAFRIQGLRGLSSGATRFLRQHPREARLVVAAALEAAAAQHEARYPGSTVDLPKSLQPFVVHRSLGPDLIGVTEAAARLEVSRTTVYDWVARKILLGWKSTKRGLTIPAEQILGPGKVVSGIAQLLAIIDDPELTWAFLSEEWPFADEVTRPIDKLKAGHIEEVVTAAPGFGTTFT
jgi:excisionase family DNA binding protein